MGCRTIRSDLGQRPAPMADVCRGHFKRPDGYRDSMS